LKVLRSVLRKLFIGGEAMLDWSFGPRLNPLHHLGALGFFFYWIVIATGIHLYAGFDTSVADAYNSVENLSHSPWFLAGVSRSLHRYASDALVIVMAVHLAREFSLDHYRGTRWLSWFTGLPIIAFVYASGIGGYWLVWDKLAQYIAIATTEWLDWLPIFGEPIARNFLAPGSLDNRFFTLLVFLHIAIPLILLLILWLHLQRISRPKINPPLGLALGSAAALVALSLAFPAASQGHADLGVVPGILKLDWFYLPLYPLFDRWSYGAVWAVMAAGFVVMLVLPWVPRLRRPAVAEVHLEWCNGCGRCAEDCPYAAITMGRRTDGLPFEAEAVVDPSLCVGCGICVGACPTSTPFRRGTDLVTGIDLPDLSLKLLRERTHEAAERCHGKPRVLVFGCDHGVTGAAFESEGIGAVSLPCIAMLPPAFVDYVLSRDLADGVFLTGCSATGCYNRLGVRWMDGRMARERDPRLRSRVPRDRFTVAWPALSEPRHVTRELAAFVARLRSLAIHPSGHSASPDMPKTTEPAA
jgi:ferredoxin/coenzyme F420-reducing hydrogenase delta subunit